MTAPTQPKSAPPPSHPLTPAQEEQVAAGSAIAGWTTEQAQKAAREREQTWQNIKTWFSKLF